MWVAVSGCLFLKNASKIANKLNERLDYENTSVTEERDIVEVQ